MERTIKEEQRILLDLYKEVKKICDKHRLLLFATGGTALGAVRHKGFIPWDDDMDFALPREDYESFVNEFYKELPRHLQLASSKRGLHHIVVDTRYEKKLDKLTADTKQDGCETGHIFVDIQPLDGVPANSFFRFIHCTRVFFFRICYKLCDASKLHTAPWRSRIENFLIILMKKMAFLFRNESKMLEKHIKLTKKYHYKNSLYIADFYGKYRYKDVYPKSWWETGIEMQFEDTTIRNMVDYHAYLTQIYGEYMTIPEEKQRYSHK